MRLLITTDTVGGVWTYTTELTRALLRKGAAVAMAVIGPPPSSWQQQWLDQTSAEWGKRFRSEACAVDLEWMSNNDGAFHHAAPLLLRLAHDFRAELLHSNQYCFGALPLAIPKLVVAHSDVLSWAAACRGQALEPSLWLDTYQHLAGKGLREASAVVAPTRWMLDALRKHFNVPAQAHVIPNGRTLPPVPAKGVRKLQAVTAGRLWDEAKNLAILRTVQAPFPIQVAGDLEYQSQTAAVLPVDVCMLGHLTEDELLDLFAQSALYLCTSLYEPFGLAPLEAAFCGCAVLANDIPSLREVWGDGATYFKDACSLQARLTEFAREPQTLAAAQHRSLLRAQRYTAARMAARYLDLYQAMRTKPERTAHVA